MIRKLWINEISDPLLMLHNLCIICIIYSHGKGGSQKWFRNFTKFSNICKIFRSPCFASKTMPSHEISVYGHVLEPRKCIEYFETLDWDKYTLKWFFSKTFCTIVISVQRSTSSSSAMKKLLWILVFSASWSSAIFKIGNHKLLRNNLYIFWIRYL